LLSDRAEGIGNGVDAAFEVALVGATEEGRERTKEWDIVSSGKRNKRGKE
jgi:hypothetical protein